MYARLYLILTACFVAFGLASNANAAWEEVLSVRYPANGMYRTQFRYKTGRFKVTKRGRDCRYVRMNYTAYGRDQFNNRIFLALSQLGSARDGSPVYRVIPIATVFELDLRSFGGRPDDDCEYTFYAEVID